MFRASDPQRSLFNAFDVLTDRQQTRMKGTWADGFRRHALPLIEERAFAGMYHDRLGTPNKPIRLMIGVLILKDLSDLTDEEARDALMFDARCLEEQTTDEFRKRHANRAGIEATNSELKRRHGLGGLRVRGLPRVNLAVLLKVAACNLKRYLQYQQALALG